LEYFREPPFLPMEASFHLPYAVMLYRRVYKSKTAPVNLPRALRWTPPKH